MKSLWDDQQACQYQDELELRVYTSRLLGQDPSLVLHGGGNTSVKLKKTNLVGEIEDILYVKGSGWDLATIEVAGFSPVRLSHLLKLAQLEQLSDSEMVNELKTQMIVVSAPNPSVEAILHAILPYRYVDHTHADAVVAVTNTENGKERIQEIYGDKVVIIPYIMPGFDLARLCAQIFPKEATDQTIGMVLMNHGIFSFGETAKESYQRMIDLVDLAEIYLKNATSNQSFPALSTDSSEKIAPILAQLRYEASKVAGFPMILNLQRTPKSLSFAQRKDINIISQQGPATPDHVIRTKHLPLLGRDINHYTQAYQDYFNTYASADHQMLDVAPRVIIDSELGICTLGKTAKDAQIVADIYDHTINVILASTGLGGYQALSAKDLFDVEYWELEQAKLKKGAENPIFTGEIALVTGAASGIGRACVNSLLKRGSAVIALDINPSIEEMNKNINICAFTCDITDEKALIESLEKGIQRFGGLDMLILNAGIFPKSCLIQELENTLWRKVMDINLDANLTLMRESYPYLKLAPNGGRVVVIGSKNVTAPGAGVAAYSVSKAALNQLIRVAILEWSKDNIRINSVHPNGVFDTGIWTDEVLNLRAQHYGLSVEDYKKNNLLKVEVTSEPVAELAIEMCSPLFAKTTGAQIPIDGGNERVI